MQRESCSNVLVIRQVRVKVHTFYSHKIKLLVDNTRTELISSELDAEEVRIGRPRRH